jgi:ABC-type nitrate/sulfonate/bicarbonate transport system permease component
MVPNWLTSIRGNVPRKVAIPLGLVPIVLLFVLWYFLTAGEPEQRVIGPTILPSPAEVIQSISSNLLT